MRSLRSGLLAVVLLAARGDRRDGQPARRRCSRTAATPRWAPAARSASSSSARRSRGCRCACRWSCQNTRTHAPQRPDARLRRLAGRRRTNTYSRIYLPADGSANVSFVVDDNSRQPEIYLSLQLHGGVGHVSLHARSEAARETCSGALGFDVRARSLAERERDHAADDRGRAGDALPAAALGEVVACRSRRRSGSRPRAPARRRPRRRAASRTARARRRTATSTPDGDDDAAVVAQQQPHGRAVAQRGRASARRRSSGS